MDDTSHILLVEDELMMANLLSAFLEKEGFMVLSASDGVAMSQQLSKVNFDAILLDLSLPGEDGLTLLRQLRMTSDIPVIVVTSRKDHDARLSALKMGADDYLVKPFDPEELLLRLNNTLKRAQSGMINGAGNQSGLHNFTDFSFNVNGHCFIGQNGLELMLTRGEFDIFHALTKAVNRVLTRGQLLDATAHFGNEPDDRAIDAYISRLRRKLSQLGVENPVNVIATVPGVGYKFIM